MKLLLSLLIVALAAGAGWFYVTQYEPLNANVADLNARNQTLTSQLSDAQTQAKSLQAQAKSLQGQVQTLTAANVADEAKLSQLRSELAAQSTPSPGASLATGPINADVNGVIVVDPPKPIGDITLNDGRSYTQCLLTKIEPDGLRVTHSLGVAKLAFTNLSADLQKQFNYDPTRAAAYSKMVAAQAANSDATRDQYEAQQKLTTSSAPAAVPNTTTTTTTYITRTVSSVIVPAPTPVPAQRTGYSPVFVEFCKNILVSDGALEHYGYHDIHKHDNSGGYGSFSHVADYRDRRGESPTLGAIEANADVQNQFLQSNSSIYASN